MDINSERKAFEAIRIAVNRITELQNRDGGPLWHECKGIMFNDLTFIAQGLIDALAARPLFAAPPSIAPLTDDQIRDTLISHGFTIKEGQSDLKPYVFAAARYLIAQARGER